VNSHIIRLSALLLASALCSAIFADDSVSSPTAAATIVTNLTLDAAQDLIRGMGFDCERLPGKDLLQFEAEGYTIYAGTGPSELYLLSMFTDVRPTQEQINKFSSKNDFAKLYTDKDGMGILSYPILLEGGVTRENLKSAIKMFRTTVVNYVRFARESGALKRDDTFVHGVQSGAGHVGIASNSPLGNRIGWYAEIVRQRIAQKWNTNGLDSGKQSSLAIVNFYVMSDGRIDNPQILQSSGSEKIDDTALRAIYDVNPLPQLPSQISENSISAQFTFNLR
jgi:TonB family protein